MLTKEDILKLSRSSVRYHLYRIRTASEGGTPHNSEDFKEYYEKQKGFTTWKDFARVWDVDEEGKHHRIVRRSMTEEEEWMKQLENLVEELPAWVLK